MALFILIGFLTWKCIVGKIIISGTFGRIAQIGCQHFRVIAQFYIPVLIMKIPVQTWRNVIAIAQKEWDMVSPTILRIRINRKRFIYKAGF
ncbi:hypothetical protein D3C75_1157120 [compost metagenome]